MQKVKEKPAGDRVLRFIVNSLTILILVFMLPHEGWAATKKSSGNPKYASIVLDAESGEVLSERYANKKLHPASLTKVMTLLLLFEALENGSVRLNDKIMISSHAASQQPSKLGLQAGSSIRVEDAILSVVTKSANDIAVAIGEHLAGSESRFAQRMTRRAHDIGMSNTTFKNASGLHNPAQVSSARDMAALARYVLIRYPNYYRYFGTKQFTYRGKTMTNHNRLMNTYPGMDGFKTGFINASGFNLIASARHGNKRLIGVVFGGRTWKSRNDHMASLLNTGFSQLSDVRYANKSNGGNVVALAAPVAQKPLPLPVPKPVFRTTSDSSAQEPSAPQNTSLASLDSGRRMVLQQPPPVKPQTPDVTEEAVASVQSAINRGDYSELTGEGDYDPGTMRRVEAGLLSAAVYRGEDRKVKQLQIAAANQASALAQQPTPSAAAPVAYTPTAEPTPAVSDLWSIQIGAYTSRVATDDALRLAASKLPSSLSHASPIVVPLKTSEGILFRARLGNFTKAEASEACRYFRDCLAVAPR